MSKKKVTKTVALKSIKSPKKLPVANPKAAEKSLNKPKEVIRSEDKKPDNAGKVISIARPKRGRPKGSGTGERKPTVRVYLDPELNAALAAKAKELGVRSTALIVQAVAAFIHERATASSELKQFTKFLKFQDKKGTLDETLQPLLTALVKFYVRANKAEESKTDGK